MLELSEPVDNPALIAAQMAAKTSRIMHGRKVDVLLSAPNLMRLPIHDVAFKEGNTAVTLEPKILRAPAISGSSGRARNADTL